MTFHGVGIDFFWNYTLHILVSNIFSQKVSIRVQCQKNAFLLCWQSRSTGYEIFSENVLTSISFAHVTVAHWHLLGSKKAWVMPRLVSLEGLIEIFQWPFHIRVPLLPRLISIHRLGNALSPISLPLGEQRRPHLEQQQKLSLQSPMSELPPQFPWVCPAQQVQIFLLWTEQTVFPCSSSCELLNPPQNRCVHRMKWEPWKLVDFARVTPVGLLY